MDHFFLILTIIILSASIIGYGAFYSNYFWKTQFLPVSYYGILGIIFLTFLSYLSNIFFAHNNIHNSVIHIIGIVFFFKYLNFRENLKDFKLLFLIIFLILSSIYIYKTHDDFPYYHLPYINNLIESKLIIGNGNFSIAHRTHSSIFYYISIFYIPLANFKFINISYFSIILFFNFFFLKTLLEKKEILNTNFYYFLKLFSFIFINVVFYRLSEYGTDRVGQIFILLLILFLIRELNDIGNTNINTNFSVLIITFLITQKTYFISYLILFFPLLFHFIRSEKKIFEIAVNRNSIFCLLIITLFFIKSFLNNGCFIYPLTFTCVETLWGSTLLEINYLSNWYELWSKGGANPNFRVEDPDKYISGINWVKNWFTSYFLFKVSDFLLGVLFICLIIFLCFFSKNKREAVNNVKGLYVILTIIFLIWFFKHPSLRYGGYTLIALMFFIPVSNVCSKFVKVENIKKLTVYFLIILTFSIFNIRNFSRIEKEINVYNYDVLYNPFKFIKEIDYVKSNKSKLPLYKPNNDQMCWLIKSPCAYKENIYSKKVFFYDMYFEN